jgi:hypothetical protein
VSSSGGLLVNGGSAAGKILHTSSPLNISSKQIHHFFCLQDVFVLTALNRNGITNFNVEIE